MLLNLFCHWHYHGPWLGYFSWLYSTNGIISYKYWISCSLDMSQGCSQVFVPREGQILCLIGPALFWGEMWEPVIAKISFDRDLVRKGGILVRSTSSNLVWSTGVSVRIATEPGSVDNRFQIFSRKQKSSPLQVDSSQHWEWAQGGHVDIWDPEKFVLHMWNVV